MELPFGFENRHNAVDPAAAVFSRATVGRSVAQQRRDEAVRSKYLAMTLSDNVVGAGGDDSEGGGARESTAGIVPVVGWSNRTAANPNPTSAAAVAVKWSGLRASAFTQVANIDDDDGGGAACTTSREPRPVNSQLLQPTPSGPSSDAESKNQRRPKMASILVRLHQIAQQEMELAEERRQLLRQLSMMVATS